MFDGEDMESENSWGDDGDGSDDDGDKKSKKTSIKKKIPGTNTMAECIRVIKSDSDWQTILTSDRVVVVQCSTSWCPPCKTLHPIMEKQVADLGGKVIFYYADCEEFQVPDFGGQVQVSSIPHVIAFKNGQIIDQFKGGRPEQAVKEWLAKVSQ